MHFSNLFYFFTFFHFMVCKFSLYILTIFFFLKDINYDSARGGVSVITEKGEITTSYLLIQRATFSDSGKYTCSPSHANPETVNVHVLNGESLFCFKYAYTTTCRLI